ncbi:DDE domain protein, partial [Candidatus Erwinia dacicola]
FER